MVHSHDPIRRQWQAGTQVVSRDPLAANVGPAAVVATGPVPDGASERTREVDSAARGRIGPRVGCSVLVTGGYDGVLLVRPVGAEYLVLPGAEVRPGESVGGAAARGLLESTGLCRAPTYSLGAARVGAEPGSVHFCCDGGTATSAEVFAESVPEAVWERVDRVAWVPPGDFDHELRPETAVDVRAALAARAAGHRLPLPSIGGPVGVTSPVGVGDRRGRGSARRA
ncbi:NUDIX domain-containing protein [Kitasatospora fiedleri]|uniref:NUDIX domain-containing protein n=1 Tax=Kitasatospora fiedleri TaxID=2991545 RepID=UPI00249B3E6C|nr:NUDIX domain-containing protein [Kitasatospora fiedleri]